MIEELLSNISPSRAALGLGLGLVVLVWVMKLRVARQIHMLGGKSPEIPTHLPVGKHSRPFYLKKSTNAIVQPRTSSMLRHKQPKRTKT